MKANKGYFINLQNHNEYIHVLMSNRCAGWSKFIREDEFVRCNLSTTFDQALATLLQSYMRKLMTNLDESHLCLWRVRHVRTCRP